MAGSLPVGIDFVNSGIVASPYTYPLGNATGGFDPSIIVPETGQTSLEMLLFDSGSCCANSARMGWRSGLFWPPLPSMPSVVFRADRPASICIFKGDISGRP